VRPALYREKLRRVELLLGAPRHQGRSPTGRQLLKTDQRRAEREIAAQHERAYQRMVADWQAARPPRGQHDATSRDRGRGHDTGARITTALEGQSRAADSVSPSGLRFASSVAHARTESLTHQEDRPGHLTFIRRPGR
jgi:hypothetical protein